MVPLKGILQKPIQDFFRRKRYLLLKPWPDFLRRHMVLFEKDRESPPKNPWKTGPCLPNSKEAQ
jgi:hypothetical protein